MKKGIFFAIPAFNEEKSLPRVIKDLKGAGYSNIVVVDDGSSDKTSRAAKKLKVVVLRNRINRGQGYSLKRAIDKCVDMGADVIVNFDSDGQHRIEDLPAMLKPVISGGYDVSLGSRFLGKSRVPLVRRLFLLGGIVGQWLFYGIWLRVLLLFVFLVLFLFLLVQDCLLED